MPLINLILPFMLTANLAHSEIDKTLSREQIKSFQSWLVMIAEDQISRGPNPRWNHQDCAGLVRFAVNESLARHDVKWRKANGFINRALPAELEISSANRQSFKNWSVNEQEVSQFVRALPLIQRNANFLGKTIEQIAPGDLLFFDQGDDQHIMIWTGKRIIYHNGQHQTLKTKNTDNGLRAVSFDELMKFSDSRWQPRAENPNFIGFYRLSFLANTKMFEQGTP